MRVVGIALLLCVPSRLGYFQATALYLWGFPYHQRKKLRIGSIALCIGVEPIIRILLYSGENPHHFYASLPMQSCCSSSRGSIFHTAASCYASWKCRPSLVSSIGRVCSICHASSSLHLESRYRTLYSGLSIRRRRLVCHLCSRKYVVPWVWHRRFSGHTTKSDIARVSSGRLVYLETRNGRSTGSGTSTLNTI